MSLVFSLATGLLAGLDPLRNVVAGAVAPVRPERRARRNAVNATRMAQWRTCFISPPEAVPAAALTRAGDHFCAGLDLSERAERSVCEGMTKEGIRAVLDQRAGHAGISA